MSDHYTIYETLSGLHDTLADMTAQDSEQEIQGIAVRALDAAVAEAKAFLGEDSVVAEIADFISADTVAQGDPIRAVDALLVVTILRDRVGRPPISIGIA